MLRNTFLAVLVVTLVAATSQATVTITTSSVDTPNLPGFKTWTLTANSTDPITAVDFQGDVAVTDPATAKGFFGTLNQVVIPLPTIFNNNNSFIPTFAPGKTAAEDSQFSVNSADPTILAVPGSVESGTFLRAAWAWTQSPGNSLAVAQLVIPTAGAATVNYRGAVTALVAGAQTDFPVTGSVGGGAPPGIAPVVVDSNLGNRIRGAVINYQFTHNPDATAAVTYGNLQTIGGPPATAPTLSAAGALSWNSAGSPLGVYNFDVTATNSAGSDVGRLTLNLVPEPATMALMSLAVVGLVGFIRKR